MNAAAHVPAAAPVQLPLRIDEKLLKAPDSATTGLWSKIINAHA